MFLLNPEILIELRKNINDLKRYGTSFYERLDKYITSLLIFLLKRQNQDGSWGTGPKESKILITDQVLRAIIITLGSTNYSFVKKGLTWLINNTNPFYEHLHIDLWFSDPDYHSIAITKIHNLLKSDYKDEDYIKKLFLNKAAWRSPLLDLITFLLIGSENFSEEERKFLDNIILYTIEIIKIINNESKIKRNLAINFADEFLVAYTIAVILSLYNDRLTENNRRIFEQFFYRKINELLDELDISKSPEAFVDFVNDYIKNEKYITLGFVLYDIINSFKILRDKYEININYELLDQIIRNIIDILLDQIELVSDEARIHYREHVERPFSELEKVSKEDVEIYTSAVILAALSSYYSLLLKNYNIIPLFLEGYCTYAIDLRKLIKYVKIYFIRKIRLKFIVISTIILGTSLIGYIIFHDIKSIYFGVLTQAIFYIIDKINIRSK